MDGRRKQALVKHEAINVRLHLVILLFLCKWTEITLGERLIKVRRKNLSYLVNDESNDLKNIKVISHVVKATWRKESTWMLLLMGVNLSAWIFKNMVDLTGIQKLKGERYKTNILGKIREKIMMHCVQHLMVLCLMLNRIRLKSVFMQWIDELRTAQNH